MTTAKLSADNLPERCVLNWQFVASDPLVALWVKLLHPVSGDGAATILVRLKPGKGHCILGNVRRSDSAWRTRRV